jgi:hypothetical protein
VNWIEAFDLGQALPGRRRLDADAKDLFAPANNPNGYWRRHRHGLSSLPEAGGDGIAAANRKMKRYLIITVACGLLATSGTALAGNYSTILVAPSYGNTIVRREYVIPPGWRPPPPPVISRTPQTILPAGDGPLCKPGSKWCTEIK